jgi:hypothetical protein
MGPVSLSLDKFSRCPHITDCTESKAVVFGWPRWHDVRTNFHGNRSFKGKNWEDPQTDSIMVRYGYVFPWEENGLKPSSDLVSAVTAFPQTLQSPTVLCVIL